MFGIKDWNIQESTGYKSGSTIRGVCYGYKHYKTAHGYHWKFQEDLWTGKE